MATQKLFTPTQFGLNTLHHRVILAPLTRYRASDDHIPLTNLVAEHYAQRAAVRETLLIAEATLISPQAGGFANVPGIWNDAQIQAWKEVVDAVHARGSFIDLQPWALGRTASPELLKKEGPYPYVEIKQYIRDSAASIAVHRADFDGVESRSGNGNGRTDPHVQLLRPADRRQASEPSLPPCRRTPRIGRRRPSPHRRRALRRDLTFLSCSSNDFIRTIWKPRPFISAGGYSRELAIKAAEEKEDLVAFGRHYIPNPDLPLRLKKNLPLTKYDRGKFYAAKDLVGYVDYRYAPENEAELGRIPVFNTDTQ
ncbi:hypothetical protein BC629DRAFT_1586969 [Irpex lacteus]|nr:hypothetical protein BC629DRAFT_1586969 [Irpex lacteus]